ncbi:MAG: hypothetical protein Q9172_004749 [Xanthocarpia lactea]
MEQNRRLQTDTQHLKTQEHLSPVKQAETDYRAFKRKILKTLPKRSQAVQESQQGLLTEIDGFLNSKELQAQAGQALRASGNALAQWDEKHQHGSRKAGRRTQEFATNFAGFVKVYGAFFDVARQAGGPYSEVAYGTLSLFFMNDDKFVNTLDELQKSFPRIEMAEELYSQASVREKVSKVYGQVILFAREATKYFDAKPLVRIMKAFTSPAPLAVDKVVQDLHRCLAEVNAEMGFLLHGRVLHISNQNDDLRKLSNDIKKQNEELKAEVKGLRAQNDHVINQNEELKAEGKGLRAQLASMEEAKAIEMARTDDENLDSLCRVLGGDPEEHRDPNLRRRTLESAFPEALGNLDITRDWSASFHQMTAELLESNTAYQDWLKSSASSLLVFEGATAPEGEARQSSSSSCWLSPAVVHVHHRFQSEGKSIAFYTCQPDYREKKTTSRLVISSLVCQMLRWKPQVLRNKDKELTAIVKSENWNSEDARIAIARQFELLDTVLKLLPADEEIILILDRLDLCMEPVHLLLTDFQQLALHSPRKLKIVVIMERILNSYVRGECMMFLKSGARHHSFGKMGWDQDRKSY